MSVGDKPFKAFRAIRVNNTAMCRVFDISLYLYNSLDACGDSTIGTKKLKEAAARYRGWALPRPVACVIHDTCVPAFSSMHHIH